MMKIAIGVSGSGTTMQAIAEAARSKKIDVVVDFVFADRECGATEKAKKLDLKVIQKGIDESIDQFHKRITVLAQKSGVELVVLAGYLRLFPVKGTDSYLVINSHPAAIPEFGGAGFWGIRVHNLVHDFAKSNDFRHPYTYSTVHVASAQYDEGDVLGLKQLEIYETDTPESIAERLLPLEHQNYIEVIGKLSEGEAQALANFDDLVLDSEKKKLEQLRQKILKKYSE